MAVAIPMAVADLVKILNLPSDITTTLFTQHEKLVMSELEPYCEADIWAQAILNVSSSDPIYFALRYAYAFMMLSSTAEFLNLRTMGEGIVKSVGLDSVSTELLSGNEIDEMKKKMEIRALNAMKAYLSEAGLMRLEDLIPRAPRKLRAGVI